MRCKTCHYDLSNLTPTESEGHRHYRCPECGSKFDPNDPSLFHSDMEPPLAARVERTIAHGLSIVLAGAVFIALILTVIVALRWYLS